MAESVQNQVKNSHLEAFLGFLIDQKCMESRRGVPQTVETSLNFHLSLAGAWANSWDSRLGELCVWKAPRSIDPASLKMR